MTPTPFTLDVSKVFRCRRGQIMIRFRCTVLNWSLVLEKEYVWQLVRTYIYVLTRKCRRVDMRLAYQGREITNQALLTHHYRYRSARSFITITPTCSIGTRESFHPAFWIISSWADIHFFEHVLSENYTNSRRKVAGQFTLCDKLLLGENKLSEMVRMCRAVLTWFSCLSSE